jgi:hypothetical protein
VTNYDSEAYLAAHVNVEAGTAAKVDVMRSMAYNARRRGTATTVRKGTGVDELAQAATSGDRNVCDCQGRDAWRAYGTY